MKVTTTYAAVVLVTFLIGLIVTSILKSDNAEITLGKHQEVEVTNTQTETTKPISQNKAKFEPEIFDVPDFSEPETSTSNIELLIVGSGHRIEDVKAKSGEIWLGLYKGEKNYFLRPDKIKVYQTTKTDFIESTKIVEVNGKVAPMVLIKNAKSLRGGEVTTVFSRPLDERNENPTEDDSLLARGFVKTFKFGDRNFTLKIKQAVNKDNRKFLALVLETGNQSQIIEYCPYFEMDEANLPFEDYLGNLIWVGDLDRDGKLDLYLDYNTHERGYDTRLYLSSEADKGQLIKKVAEYSPTGC